MELPANPNELHKGVYSREGRLDDPKRRAEQNAIEYATLALSNNDDEEVDYFYGRHNL